MTHMTPVMCHTDTSVFVARYGKTTASVISPSINHAMYRLIIFPALHLGLSWYKLFHNQMATLIECGSEFPTFYTEKNLEL
jgi:hypothetical protein